MGKERPKGLLECPHLDADAIEQLKEDIAIATVERLENKIYLKVGRGIVHKLLWLIGLSAVSLYAWLGSKGLIP